MLGRPFLDISDRVTTGGESGLLSMAFARDYASSRRFYVYYTDQQGFLQIDQFRAAAGAPNRADPGSRRSVIRVAHHRSNHKGGQLQVGPTACSTPASATAAAAATRTRTRRTSAASSAS